MELGEGIKELLLAGIGTAAVTAEKSKVLEELVKKGELTVETGQGSQSGTEAQYQKRALLSTMSRVFDSRPPIHAAGRFFLLLHMHFSTFLMRRLASCVRRRISSFWAGFNCTTILVVLRIIHLEHLPHIFRHGHQLMSKVEETFDTIANINGIEIEEGE